MDAPCRWSMLRVSKRANAEAYSCYSPPRVNNDDIEMEKRRTMTRSDTEHAR
jgi:hypothetical protein